PGLRRVAAPGPRGPRGVPGRAGRPQGAGSSRIAPCVGCAGDGELCTAEPDPPTRRVRGPVADSPSGRNLMPVYDDAQVTVLLADYLAASSDGRVSAFGLGFTIAGVQATGF